MKFADIDFKRNHNDLFGDRDPEFWIFPPYRSSLEHAVGTRLDHICSCDWLRSSSYLVSMGLDRLLLRIRRHRRRIDVLSARA